MSVITPELAKTGNNVTLTLIDNPYHAINGTVTAIATYDVAKAMQTDLAAKHAAIQSYCVETGKDPLPEVTAEQFLILDVGGIRPTVVAFDWIVQIELVERGATYKIKLLNTSKEKADEAIALLRAKNIACQLDVVY